MDEPDLDPGARRRDAPDGEPRRASEAGSAPVGRPERRRTADRPATATTRTEATGRPGRTAAPDDTIDGPRTARRTAPGEPAAPTGRTTTPDGTGDRLRAGRRATPRGPAVPLGPTGEPDDTVDRARTARRAAPSDPTGRTTDPDTTDRPRTPRRAGPTARTTAPDDTADRPRTGRRRAPEDPSAPRGVGTSRTGRSVSRARAEAGTERVPARPRTTTVDRPAEPATDQALAPTRTRSADRGPEREADSEAVRPGSPDPRPDTAAGRLRADRIDETLTRLTAAHAGLVLAARDRDEDDETDDDALLDAEDDDEGEPARRVAVAAALVGRWTAAAVALLLVLVSGMGWVGRTRLDGALHRVAAVDVPPDGVLDAAAQTDDRNVLLLATDSGGSARATTRANTVVVVHTDGHTGRTVAVTLPSDLEITRPPCERFDPTAAAYLGQTVPAEPRTTFDSAYAVGGPRCATRAAQQVTGLAITRFAAVDLSSTAALVEAVGGVEVCVERPVLDAVVGPVVPTAGTTLLGGARAGDLVRATDVRDDPTPATSLVQRQQRVLSAALAQALSPERLLHPGRTGRVLPALGTAVVSTGSGVDDLLAVSRTVARADRASLVAAPTDPAANSRGNRVLRGAEATALFAAVRTDGPLPPVDPATTATAPTPADVTADVLNASGKDGLASQVAGTLGELGFHTAEVTNATQPALDTVIRFSPDRAQQAQLLAAAVPSASTVPDPGKSGVLQLVLGRSFDGTVRAAAAPAGPADTAPATPAASCA